MNHDLFPSWLVVIKIIRFSTLCRRRCWQQPWLRLIRNLLVGLSGKAFHSVWLVSANFVNHLCQIQMGMYVLIKYIVLLSVSFLCLFVKACELATSEWWILAHALLTPFSSSEMVLVEWCGAHFQLSFLFNKWIKLKTKIYCKLLNLSLLN